MHERDDKDKRKNFKEKYIVYVCVYVFRIYRV